MEMSMGERIMEEIFRRSFVPIQLSWTTFEPADGVVASPNPLIFLHGVTACKETWADIPQKVADATKRKAYAYDCRNHGDSEWSESISIDVLVRDLEYFVDSLTMSSVVLVGHSMGGKVAIHFALKYPARVEALVIEEMFVKSPPVGMMSVPLALTTLGPEAVRLIPRSMDETEANHFIMDYVYRSMSALWANQQEVTKPDKTAMALRRSADGRFVLKANMRVLEKSIRAEMANPPQELRGVYGGPACFIYGELSYFRVGSEKENILQYFPEAEFVQINEAGHIVHMDQPTDFTDSILKFLNSKVLCKK